MAFALSPKNLARSSALHPKLTLGIWALILIASFMLVGSLLKDATTTEAKITNKSESVEGKKLLEDKLRGPFRSQEAVVIESNSLKASDPAFKAYAQDIYTRINALGPSIIEKSISYYDTGAPTLIPQNQSATLFPITMAGSISESQKNIDKVLKIVEDANGKNGFTGPRRRLPLRRPRLQHPVRKRPLAHRIRTASRSP